ATCLHVRARLTRESTNHEGRKPRASERHVVGCCEELGGCFPRALLSCRHEPTNDFAQCLVYLHENRRIRFHELTCRVGARTFIHVRLRCGVCEIEPRRGHTSTFGYVRMVLSIAEKCRRIALSNLFPIVVKDYFITGKKD